MWKEFKTFAMRGNVVDMAVGIGMMDRSDQHPPPLPLKTAFHAPS